MDKIKFCDLLDYEQPQKYIVLNDQYTENGKYPVLTAGKSFILGYTNEINEVYNNLPVIIFDDFTCDCKYVDFPFVVKSSAMKMLKPKNDNVNLKYCFYYMNYIDYKISEHKRHWISIYSQLDIKKHDLKIQQKIVDELDCLSDIIEKKKQQLADLDNLVKSKFIEMFGDLQKYDINTLGQVSSLITKGASPSWQGVSYVNDEEQTLFITSENVLNNELDLTKPKYVENIINEIQPRSMLKKGDILVNIVGASIGRVAMFNLDKTTNINQAVCLLRIPNEIMLNKEYLLYYMNSDYAMKYYLENQVSVARANLSLKNISDMGIPTPPIELQYKFADFVKNIEKSKNDIKKSIEETQNLFNERMQHYFGD